MSHPTRALIRCLSWLLTAGLLTSCAEEKASISLRGDAAAATAADGGAPAKEVSGASAAVEVTIDDGPLKGKLVGAVRQFLGIPYAKPPLGELRWQPPQPVTKWTAMRSATEFGKRCAQSKSDVLMNAASEDEDCLYLNVFAPKSANALPVMLWIHGGGNVNGSASEPVPYANSGLFYDGSILSEKGVVVVTINYRLGVFGFFDHAGLGGEGGNQGLLDQVATMRWVKNNIAQFGGDPTNVTIFGESAGSLDVCLHVASPKSRGLFHKAISQSGGCTTLTTTKQLAVENAAKFAASLDCEGEDEETIDCLRNKTVPELIAGSPADLFGGRAFGPDIDGVFLTEQVRSTYDSGDIAKVPFMLGSNSDEGTLFTLNAKVADQAAYDAALTTTFGDAALGPIKALYPIDKFMDGLPNPFAAAYARVWGDSRLVCSTTDAAIRAVAAGSTVYMYNFDIPVPATVAPTLGASHGAELTSVFGTSPTFTEEAKAASEMIQRYWTNFAKTGTPNGGDDLEWPARTASTDVRINLAFEPTLVDDFRAAECEFWRAGYERQFSAP